MTMTQRPRAEERADLAGHPPAAVEDEELEEVRRRYSSWNVGRGANGDLAATHRTEQPNPRLERAGWRTTVTARSVRELEQKLFVQTALRGDGHLAGGGK
jgi:hypothetical protein